MKNVYLASACYNRTLIEAVRLLLESKLSLKVISSWHRLPPMENLKERAVLDFGEIDIADIVIAFYPYGLNGTICELTYSFCKKKHILYVRGKEAMEEDPLIIGIFEDKYLFNTIEDLIAYLEKI